MNNKTENRVAFFCEIRETTPESEKSRRVFLGDNIYNAKMLYESLKLWARPTQEFSPIMHKEETAK